MANTNAFAMRRKNEALWAKYRTVLDKLAESSSKKRSAYEEYLFRLNGGSSSKRKIRPFRRNSCIYAFSQ